MQSTIESRTFKSTISGAILFLVNSLQSILLVPLFLSFWGKEKYGIWLSIISFISLIKTIEIGHQNYVGNEFNKWFFLDKKAAYKILGASFWISFFLGFFEFILFTTFLLYCSGFIFGDLSITHFQDPLLKVSLLFYVFIWSVLGSIGGLLVRIILPIGLFAKTTNLSIISKVSELFILLLLVLLKFDLSVVFFGLGVINLIYSLIVFNYVRKVLPEFYPWWISVDWKLGFRNYLKSVILTLNAFADQFNSSSIIILINQKLGVLLLPVFTSIRTLTNVVLQVTSMVTNPLSPELIRFHSRGEKEKLCHVIETNLFVGGLLVNIPFLLVAPFVEFFFNWWTSGKLEFDYSLYYVFTVSIVFVNFGRSYLSYLSGINDLANMSLISISRVIVSIGLSLLLMSRFGLLGIGLAILASEILSSFVLPVFIVSIKLYASYTYFINKNLFLSFLQVLFLSIYYTVYLYIPTLHVLAYIVILPLMFLSSYFQWQLLDAEVQKRLVSVINEILCIVKIKRRVNEAL